jgi:Txe/YoeB family toxin of Txe-Axe toxin-antitoxin module
MVVGKVLLMSANNNLILNRIFTKSTFTYEAVSKLFDWKRENDINTYGLNELIKHYRNETYPGLGTVKKLSIMHHIELMSQYLAGEHSL